MPEGVKPPPSLRFLCDEMLHRLGRWLRAAGYDTVIATGGVDDGALLARACAEGRLLLTRDRGLPLRRAAPGMVVLLSGAGVHALAADLSTQVPVDWLAAPFSRCLVCNLPVAPAEGPATAEVPEPVRRAALPVTRCGGCGRLYWPGGHERRLRRTLETLAAAAQTSPPAG